MTRREWLALVFGRAGLGLLAGASLGLAACNRERWKTKTPEQCAADQPLTAEDERARKLLSYLERSPIPKRLCANCRFYRATFPGECGSCFVLKGRIHPAGWCRRWIRF
ncbi:MAG: high-potential iron-sulfur protein [Deltaproteobacteria bacterium]|nr:high-potential iron-sulfur protein [Deltaproteobacteria bacterium]